MGRFVCTFSNRLLLLLPKCTCMAGSSSLIASFTVFDLHMPISVKSIYVRASLSRSDLVIQHSYQT